MLRGDEIGLFWEEQIIIKEPKPVVAKEPVVLKPYVARAPLHYEPLTDEELEQYAGTTLIFDTESFSNLFVVAFKHVNSQHVLTMQLPFDIDKMIWILENYTVVGFNSFKYDWPLLCGSFVHHDTDTLKMMSTELIHGMWGTEVARRYGFELIKPRRHIDLIEVCPLRGSLKLYGARLHAKRIQDVPWADQYKLEDWQIPVTVDYCINDLDNTELLFKNLTEQLMLRHSLSREYNQDLLSRSDAQIAEAVIGIEIKKIKGRTPKRSNFTPGKIYRFQTPANLMFQTDYMRDILRTVEGAEFVIDGNGYLVRPKEISELKVTIGEAVYRMGIGGLHSSEHCSSYVADDNHIIADRDVSGYYPAIALQCQLYPKSLGRDFLTVYRNLVERRLAAKKAKNLAVSENLKVTVNGTFGKTGSPHSILYAPDVIIQILLGGQLYLLMLIEALELAGIKVISANTDGVAMYCPVEMEQVMQDTIADWERRTGFETEEARYRAIYSRDVNAYLAVRTDGKVKGKNIFYDPWRAGTNAKDLYWRFQKNPTCQVCVEAVERYITDKVPVRQTIESCSDITRFIAVKNVTGGAHWDGHYLGKVVRWYYAKDVPHTINYINSNRIVADSEGARPLMDLPEEFPPDVDLDRYVQRCEDMLREMAFTKEKVEIDSTKFEGLAREIIEAFVKLGGHAHYIDIAREVGKARETRGEDVPQHIEASVRSALQRHCSQSPSYKGKQDLFQMVGGEGWWKIKSFNGA